MESSLVGSTLIIIRGNSASGKTTLAKALQKTLGHGVAMLVSQDVVRREMAYVKDGLNNKSIPIMQNLIEYGSKNFDFVIFEGILKAEWYSELISKIAPHFINVLSYYYDLTFEETLVRHKTKSVFKEFGETEMKQWFIPHDLLNLFNEKIFDSKKSQKEALQDILNDINKNKTK